MDLERVLDRWEEEGHTLGDKEANRSKATGGVLGRMATEGVKHTIFDDPALLELLSQTKDWGAEQQEDEHVAVLIGTSPRARLPLGCCLWKPAKPPLSISLV